MSGWIGVDLDGTLAEYHGWRGAGHIGSAIRPMVERVRTMLAAGKEVRIMTARVSSNDQEAEDARMAIRVFCVTQFGRPLPVTCIKDYHMVELWDDRAVSVEKNTGRVTTEVPLAADSPATEDAREFARWLSGGVAGDMVTGWENYWTAGIERRDAATRAASRVVLHQHGVECYDNYNTPGEPTCGFKFIAGWVKEEEAP